MVAPAATPRAIVDKLNAAINQALESDEVRPALARLAVETRIGSPDAFGAFLTKEREKWTVVVKQANIQMSE